MKVFFLVDCNNFYASCERVFKPELRGKPVVVLSNNDGVIIARSNEAKALGIKMQPVFEIKDLIKKHDIKVFSTNFTLYGDMSDRVMQVLAQFSDNMEIYSIDEAFLEFNYSDHQSLEKLGQEIRKTVYQWTGIPVSVGIGPTKTLAKAANELAKKNPEFNGVLNLTLNTKIDQLLTRLPIEDVWGIGRKHSVRLKSRGIKTACHLKYIDQNFVKKRMHTPGLQTVLELNGTSCIKLEESLDPKKNIVTSRSFGSPVETLEDLKKAVADFVCIASEKLRTQNSVAGGLQIFIMTNRFKQETFYANAKFIKLTQATSFTPDLIRYAHKCLEKIFRPGLQYKKAGVLLTNISANAQPGLFEKIKNFEKRNNFMAAIDKINQKWGRGTIINASVGIQKGWKMRQLQKSARYTTDWQNLLVVKA